MCARMEQGHQGAGGSDAPEADGPAPVSGEQKDASPSDSSAGEGKNMIDAAPESKASEDGAPRELWMVCQQCRYPIVSPDNVIPGRAETWAKTVFAYELDIMGRQVWCYSATNPSAHRFDVLRARPRLGAAIAVTRAPDVTHSWFPGFAWQMASCAACDTHLGWAFSTAREGSAPTEPAIDFFGLISTRLAETKLLSRRRAVFERKRQEVSTRSSSFQVQMAEVRRVLNQLPTAAAADFHHILYAMQSHPYLRLGVAAVLQSARARLAVEGKATVVGDAAVEGAVAEGPARAGGSASDMKDDSDSSGAGFSVPGPLELADGSDDGQDVAALVSEEVTSTGDLESGNAAESEAAGTESNVGANSGAEGVTGHSRMETE